MIKINPILTVLLLLATLWGCSGEKKNSIQGAKPNILLMIADDMGYGDLGCYGGPSETPALNSLAGNGILFTDFYAAAPNCTPSRAGLLTGRSPFRSGIYNYRSPNHIMHLRESELTLAEVLKDQGYQTSHIGKWHLGCLPQDPTLGHPQPHEQGFDYSLGTENNAIPSHLNPVNFVRNGRKLEPQEGYSCQILADEAVTWLENHRNAEDPFFLYMAFHEPHHKVASPPELVAKYSDRPKREAEYLANIENLDLAVEKIIQYLTDNHLIDNTLIIFSSDNGSYRLASNGGFRAVKSYLYEGGIRVPGIIHWPPLKQKGVVVHEPVGFVDIMPTFCDLLNIDPFEGEELDGTSILNLLTGQEFTREKPLFWFYYRTSPEIAMRIDEFMIMGKDHDTIPRTHPFTAPDMAYIMEMSLSGYEMYDLSADPHQDYNQVMENPRAEEYIRLLNDQLKEIQSHGYQWKQLPEAITSKKVKTDWVKY